MRAGDQNENLEYNVLMKKPKILLVRPPESMGLVGRQIIHEPFNLLTLAAVARQNGADVRLADYAVSPYSASALQNLLREFPADLAGFSCMTQDIHVAAEVAGTIKEIHPQTITVAGGVHPSVLPERTLEEFDSFDLVVAGEGERTVAEIIKRMVAEEEIKGVAGTVRRKQNGQIITEQARSFMQELDEVPLPARDLAPMEIYLNRTSTPGISGKVVRVGTIFSARGCPYNCTFCSGWQTCGKKPRLVPSDRIAEEIEQLVNKWGVRHITIKDDTFTIDREKTIEIGQMMDDAKVTWDCKTRINVVDEQLLREMKRLGCVRLHLGVESGSDRVLKLIRKNTTVEQIERAFAITRELGFERTSYFIIGSHPSETYDEFLQSRALCKKIKPDYAVFSVIVPYPGTEVYDLMKMSGQILSEDWRRYNPFVQVPAWHTDHFSPEDLMNMQKQAMTAIYLSPHFIATKLKTLRHAAAWGYWARSAIDFWKYRSTR